MNLFIDAYLDRNIGDDLMVRHIAEHFAQHTFFIRAADKTLLLPFRDIKNLHPYNGEEFEILLTVGGSMFELGSSKVIINRLKTTVREYKKLLREGKKIATIGCNIGNVRKFALFAIKCQLRSSTLITVRDSQSYDRLSRIGLHPVWYPDLLFCRDIEPKENRTGLAISVYRSLSYPEKNLQCYQKYAEIADSYTEKTGENVRLIAFDCERENDIAAAFTIKSLMKYPERAEIIAYTGEYQEIFDAVSSSACLLGTRFHSIVFAMLAGVPVLPVCYSEKTYGMLRDLHYQGHKIEYSDLGAADTEEICSILMGRDHLLTLSREHLIEIKKKANGHIEELEKFFTFNQK